LPIYPAKCHIDGIPSLFLHPSQKLVRDNWVYVREPYRCPNAWLEETWAENWLLPHLSRKITSKSIHALVLYARSKRYDPSIYDKVLRRYGTPDVSPRPPLRITLPMSRTVDNSNPNRCYPAADSNSSRRGHEITQQTNSPQRVRTVTSVAETRPVEPAGGSSYWGRATWESSRHSASCERTNLLPYAVNRQTVVRYGAAGTTERRSNRLLNFPFAVNRQIVVRYEAAGTTERRSNRLLHFLGVLIGCVFLCALIFGLCYGIYTGVKLLVAFWNDTIWPFLSSVWVKVVNWVKGLFSGL